MKLKKIVSIIAVSAMSLALLAGCGSGDNSKESTTAAKTEAETTETTEAETTEAEVTDAATEAETTEVETTEATEVDTTEDASAETGKTLVVYYSATGSTRAVAQVAADTLGADLFEITPVEPYSSDDLNWTNDDSRVSREHNDESLRDVELTQVTPENWDSYDTVLIGYPIWWAIAAWPVDNFVKGNDFTGKTVIPFCTSASSGLGDSGYLLEQMAGTGDWQEGQRFSSGASESEVADWANSLGIAN